MFIWPLNRETNRTAKTNTPKTIFSNIALKYYEAGILGDEGFFRYPAPGIRKPTMIS
jgi:hypothetical protein